MILKGKAVTPKASSATSVYPAVIIKIQSGYGAFTYLQIFCPSVMSGSLTDAKFCSSNWIDAPTYPHDGDGVLPYDYKVGGIVLVSYQDGNVNSPQFVRYVVVDDNIISRNQKYVGGAAITADSEIFDDIFDNTINTDSVSLKKGMKLLKAVEACSSAGACFHTYGFDDLGISKLSGIQYLTIWRCGKFGTEFVYKQQNKLLYANPDEANSDYIETAGLSTEFCPQNIIRYLMQNENSKTINENLIDIVNKTIKEFETDSKYKKNYFDKNNIADVLFWYTKIAGYVYDTKKDSKHDMSTKMSAGMRSEIDNENIKVSSIPAQARTAVVLNYTGDASVYSTNVANSLYHNVMRTRNYTDTIKTTIIAFINKLWYNISKNSFFDEMLSSRYAMIVSNHLFSMQSTYGVSSITNKALLICAVLATAFPVIEKITTNFDLVDESLYTNTTKTFMKNMKKLLSSTNPSIKAEDIATGFRNIYFETLGFPEETRNIFKDIENAYGYIYNHMLMGINYILKNYESISDVLDTSTSTGGGGGGTDSGSSKYGFIWPFPGVTNITSPFGYRVHPITGKQSLHTGIDIAGNSPYGKNVIAAMDGTVEKIYNRYSANNGTGYGNYVLIKHNDTYKTRYAHLLSVAVKVGDTVNQGQTIGKCDNTGSSTGSHLHFEIIVNGTPENPLKYVSVNNKYTGTNKDTTGGTHTGYYNVNLSHDVQDYLFKRCSEYGIPSALMIALIDHESGFNPKAEGKNSNGTYDRGLCQLNSAYYDTWMKKLKYTTYDIYDPKTNIHCGCYVLGGYIRTTGTTREGMHKALMAYNMGAGGAGAKWKQGIYTSSYSLAVMALYDKYA